MGQGVEIIRIGAVLPPGIDRLLEEAESEGVRNVRMLVSAWASGEEQFDRKGAALFGAFSNEQCVGLGGVTRQSGLDEPAMRMRRFYVSPSVRGQGVGRLLAQAAIRQGLAHARLLTCNARATPAAGPFWLAMGFMPASLPNITHICRRV
ncbi:GNAT family N-acetyltransferase [Hyphomonas pacifica]|uniref:GNAT family N-acetyltransferase n=1 Tax=Hyphomonas pacifica TaxID=1280941 RepID=UPI000DBF6C26|nr:GNAT family N-acetyltransferase [Hyphomonas pacifica]RAN32942.1 hypothetical protein HY11_04430 [Hyphomonas pacifica]